LVALRRDIHPNPVDVRLGVRLRVHEEVRRRLPDLPVVDGAAGGLAAARARRDAPVERAIVKRALGRLAAVAHAEAEPERHLRFVVARREEQGKGETNGFFHVLLSKEAELPSGVGS